MSGPIPVPREVPDARGWGCGLLPSWFALLLAGGRQGRTPEEEPVLPPNGPWMPGPALPTVRTAGENTSEHDKLL